MLLVALLVSTVLFSFSCSTLTTLRVIQLFKYYRDLPPFREVMLHAPVNSFAEPAAALTVRAQLQSVMDNKPDISNDIVWDYFSFLNESTLPEMLFSGSYLGILLEEILDLPSFTDFGAKPPNCLSFTSINALKSSRLNDPFFTRCFQVEGYSANSSTFPALFSDPSLKDLLGNVITYRLVSVFFESEDHDFIRFLLEKVTGSWELVNKTETGPYKDLTFEAFRDAKLTPFRAVHQGIYVKESLLDDFFNFKFGDKVFDKEAEFIPDDENVAVVTLRDPKIAEQDESSVKIDEEEQKEEEKEDSTTRDDNKVDHAQGKTKNLLPGNSASKSLCSSIPFILICIYSSCNLCK